MVTLPRISIIAMSVLMANMGIITIMVIMSRTVATSITANVQNGYNAHNKFFAPWQTGKGLILPEDFFGGQHQNRDGLVPKTLYLTFSYANFTVGQLKHTGINNYLINMIDNKLPLCDLSNYPLAIWYCLLARKMIAFNCMFEVSITWPWKTGTRYLWLKLYPSSQSVNSNRKKLASYITAPSPWCLEKSTLTDSSISMT